MTLLTQIRATALAHPDRIALCGGGQSLTYRQLEQGITTLAEALSRAGVRRLAIALDNGLPWALIDLACLQAGILSIPVPGFFSKSQQAWLLESSGADALAVSGAQAESQLTERGADWRLEPCEGYHLLRRTISAPAVPDGTAKITYTSGTTGQPKGVCLSQSLLEAVCASLAGRVAPSGVVRHLTLLPLTTLLENLTGLYVPLLMGAQSTLPSLNDVGFTGSSSLDPSRFAALLMQERPHSLVLVPELLRLLVGLCRQQPALASHLAESLRFVAVGGGKVSPALLMSARQLGLPVYEGYGLSECGSVVALSEPGCDRIGSVGRVLPHCRVTLAPDGEVLVEGAAMLGYLGEPPQRGPIATGDLGQLDEEGFLSITGRKKNVQITAFGRNFSPEWIEAEAQLEPAIARCVIFGDGLTHNVALLQPMPGMESALPLQVERLNQRLPDYARIHHWFVAPLTEAAGLLTANGRPRREQIFATYRTRIEQLCQGETL
ncbi:AMP-binding protein [Aeromonas diversa]|uniref:AMP-binding protein n=1 Tax=Aeromonas diversa TaxID=502790 RepID=UPI003463410D